MEGHRSYQHQRVGTRREGGAHDASAVGGGMAWGQAAAVAAAADNCAIHSTYPRGENVALPMHKGHGPSLHAPGGLQFAFLDGAVGARLYTDCLSSPPRANNMAKTMATDGFIDSVTITAFYTGRARGKREIRGIGQRE
jgi:hypothetical protein